MSFAGFAIVACLLLSGFFVIKSVGQHFIEQDYDELKIIIETVEQRLDNINGNINQAPDVLSQAVSGHHGVYFQVETPPGTHLFHSNGAEFFSKITPTQPSKVIDKSNLASWEIDSEIYRGLAVDLTIEGTQYRIMSAMDMAFHLSFLDKFKEKMWLLMLGIGVVTLTATWFGINQGHRPLIQLSRRIRNIQTNQLDERVEPESLPIELRELAQSFNQMLQHLEEGFERLSNFSADIAHELRTPLTNLITQTQVGLTQARPIEQYKELLYSNLEEQERLAKMVSDMLWLAQSDNKLIQPTSVLVDLSSEIKDLFEFFDALAAENQITLTLEGEAPAIPADRELLKRALSNLLSNAIRHTPYGETITVKIGQDKNHNVYVEIINPGEHIPIEQLSKIFDRFYRVDPSRNRISEGTGLGLAITKSIIETHGGRITVESNNAHTIFTVNLPLAM
jgi:two-component system heavy metal sensor histidine kinase CusS